MQIHLPHFLYFSVDLLFCSSSRRQVPVLEKDSSSFFSVQGSSEVQSPCSVEQGLRLHRAAATPKNSTVLDFLPSLAEKKRNG
jgi:hypothetical protein